MFVTEAALIALREGLEAFLIVGILLGFVTKLGRPDARKWVWLGLGLGVAGSLLAGLIVHVFLLDTFEARGGGEWFELVAALVAVVVLTYMVFWMWKHTRSLMVGLREKIGDALSKNTLGVIVLLTFASVIREGLEVVLFYGALAGRNAALDLAWSGFLGAVLSIGIVLAILKTTVSFNLQKFFGITGILLVFVAAGLLVHSIHASVDLGLLPAGDALWDTSGAISDDGAAGRILHALFGYTAAPSLLQSLLYFGYLFGIGIPYLASLGLFTRRPEKSVRKSSVVAVAAVVWLATLVTAIGAANPAGIAHHGSAHELDYPGRTQHDAPLANATRALANFDGKVGILIRDHGEAIHYNASTYEAVKEFVRHIWPYTGLPAELLTVDQGSYFLDAAHPFSPKPQTGATLVDPWVKPWNLPAAPVGDAAEQGVLEDLCGHSPLFYLTPGVGPGMGEGDVFEIIGLCVYRDWLKMGNYSPRYDQGTPTWEWLAYHLQKHFGDRVVVAFAHGHDPKVDPDETLDAAAGSLVQAGVTVVLDAYQSSIHSDAMDTCMMRPHAAHALRAAGFNGNIIQVGMAGHDPRWADAAASRGEELLAGFNDSLPVSVHLVHHGSKPGSKNPCEAAKTDQYHANAKLEYDLASAEMNARFQQRGNVTVRMVYGQGAGAADDGVLSPLEALERDRADGIRNVVMLPYEVWGDGVDTLVYLRESLGFQPASAPYYDSQYETRFTRNGVTALIPSAAYGMDAKSEALLSQIGKAIESL